jgi:hypothetical protein
VAFDNAPGQEAVQRFLPPAGRGRVLITSQSAAWAGSQAVEVPVLDTAVAAGFLVNRTGDADERTAEDLAGELGGLPLALEQAAAYIQATGTTLAGCLSVFRDRQADLCYRHDYRFTDRRSMACSWVEMRATADARSDHPDPCCRRELARGQSA